MFSAVIPTYNRSALLKRAIDSALAQGDYASEVIVVDDGSTDDTQEVCASYGKRIEYVRQKNAGASVARNTGAARARNTWIAFLDSDDFWTPSHLERMEKAIHQTDGAAQFYFSDMQMSPSDDSTTLWQMTHFAPPKQIHLVKDGTNWAFQHRQPTMLQCSVFRKDVWEKNGGLDPRFRLMHDSELFFRLSIGASVCAVAGVACVQTSDDESNVRLTTAVHAHDAGYWNESIALWTKVLRGFPDLPPRYRRVARFSLASAHWRLLRLRWSQKDIAASLSQLPKLGLVDPRFAFSLLVHRNSESGGPRLSVQYD